MSRYKSLFSNTLIFAVGNFTSKFALFLLVPLYTSVLITQEVGVQDFFNTLTELLMPVLTLGMVEAVLRFAIDKNSDKSKVLTIALKISIISSLIVAILSPIGFFFFPKKLVLIFVAGFIAFSFRSLFAQFARGAGYSAVFAKSGIIVSFSLVLSNLLFLLVFRWGLNGFLLSYVISNIFGLIYLIFAAKIPSYIKWDVKDKVLLKQMLIYSLPLIPNTLSWWIINYSNRYIVLILTDMTIVGLLAAAAKIPSMISMISAIFQSAWQLSSAQEYEQKDKNEFYSSVWNVYNVLVFLCGSGLILCLPIISKIMLQKDFIAAADLIPFLLVGSVFSTMTAFFGAIYMASKKTLASTLSTLSGAVLNIILCFILIPQLKGIGAGIAAMCSYFLICIYRILNTRKYVIIKSNWLIFALNSVILLVQAYISIWQKDISLISNLILFTACLALNFKAVNMVLKTVFSKLIQLFHSKLK